MDSNRPTRWTGIACPKCQCTRLDVYYTRHRGGCLIRVRTCALCGKRIPTVEAVVGRVAPPPEPPCERPQPPQPPRENLPVLVEKPEEFAIKKPKAAKKGKKFHRQNGGPLQR